MTTKLTLSPEAWAALRPSLTASYGDIYDQDGALLGYVLGDNTSTELDAEIAAFIAALVNAALTPADPGAAEPVTGRTVLDSGSAGRAGDQVTS